LELVLQSHGLVHPTFNALPIKDKRSWFEKWCRTLQIQNQNSFVTQLFC